MVDFARLPTEQSNPRSRRLDLLSTEKIIHLMNDEDRCVLNAVRGARAGLTRAVNLVVQSLSREGRLFLFGAGTSGRLCVLEAAECPPTFNTRPGQIQAFMAGGKRALFRSQEGAEDREPEARRLVGQKVRLGDVLVGVAASGVTPFVRAALSAARRKRAGTILISCNPSTSLKSLADVLIPLKTGPEILAGSTRMKAGSATKMALNILTTASMVRLGKVYGHWMVDLQPRSKKLVARGLRLIQRLGGVSEKEALRLFRQARGRVKPAVLMARRGVSFTDAQRLLKSHRGSLRKSLD